jgi:hypothetical protein
MAGGSLITRLAEQEHEARTLPWIQRKYSSNDKVRVALIGSGIQGHGDLAAALKVPGVELAAACDLYKGRLEGMKESYLQRRITGRF